MIEIIDKNEKLKTRKLWETVFIEDSKNFLDYYYNIKINKNRILCKVLNNTIVSMIHLNPYKLSFNNKEIKSYYIVGVATHKEHRKKGYMKELLNTSLKEMYKENIPFTFLMPAKESIYSPFDFRYVYNQKYLKFKDNLKIEKKEISNNNLNKVSNFINLYLKNNYEIFTLRDFNYIKNLKLELESENGKILEVYNNNKFSGYYIYWGNNEKSKENLEVRAIYCLNNITEIKKTEPKIMARIINLKSFLSNTFLIKNNIEKIFYLNITDKILKENNGLFKWTISSNKSVLEKCNYEINKDKIINIKISEITSWILGYISLDYLIKENLIVCNCKKTLDDLNLIKCFKKILLDEIV